MEWQNIRLIEMDEMLDNSFNSKMYIDRDAYLERGFQAISHRLYCFCDNHLHQGKFCYQEFVEWCDAHVMHCYK